MLGECSEHWMPKKYGCYKPSPNFTINIKVRYIYIYAYIYIYSWFMTWFSPHWVGWFPQTPRLAGRLPWKNLPEGVFVDHPELKVQGSWCHGENLGSHVEVPGWWEGVHGNHGIVQRKLEQVMLLLDLYPVPHCSTILPDWLVVWNMAFIFPYIGNNHPNWLIFFRGVGIPPTSRMSLVMFLLDLLFSAISSGHQGFHHQIGDPPSRPTILPRKSPVVNE